MFHMMKAWMETARFAADSQQVIALRMMRIAAGGPLAATETTRMVSEKVAAFGEAQSRFVTAMMTGAGMTAAATKAYVPYRRAVRANSRRLGV